MSNNIGRLIQSYITVMWGDENLSFADDGEGGKQILAQDITFSLPAEGNAPTLDFSVTPNPIGFKTFERLKNNAIDKPITVTIGYPNSKTKVQFSFRFAGFNLTTGFDPEIKVNCVSVAKGSFTDNKVSYTMEKPMKLSELPEFLRKKAGPGAKDLQFQWVGTALKEAQQYDYQENIKDRTPYSILLNAMRAAGIKVETGDTVLQGTVVLTYDPSLKGETEANPPKLVTSGAEAKPASKNVYIIGPGLMSNITRTQKFGTGQSDPTTGAAKNNPKSYEQEQKNVEQGKAGNPQKTSAESTNTQGGTSGTPSKNSSMSRSPKSQDKKAKDARAAVSSMIQTEISFEVPMVPNIVGIKASDFIVIPSLKGPGNYLEDWVLTEVKYTQQPEGNVTVSCSGKRPFTGMENFLDAGTLAEVKGVVSRLKTPANWSKFYWIEGNDPDYPLGG